MSRFVVYTAGTFGDHLPHIALARRLVDRGHQVLMVINQAMHRFAQKAGLEVRALTDITRGEEEAREYAWCWDHWNHPDPTAHPNAAPFDEARFGQQVDELAACCQGRDMLLATAIRPHGAAAAHLAAIPWLTLSVNPYAFWIPSDPREREVRRVVRAAEHEQLAPIIGRVLAARGRSADTGALHDAWLFAPHVILGSSAHFSLPDLAQLQPLSTLDITGFWFYEDPDWATWTPDPDLERFCEDRPLILTFSSQPLEDPARILAVHAEAAARLKRRLLVMTGWAGFSADHLPAGVPRDLVRFEGFLPHDWVFARASAVLTHGGIGTIARALRSGCPLLIEPFGNDQFYNAGRVASLGVGAAVHPFKATPEGLASVLTNKVLTPPYRERAVALGERLRQEDGVGVACDLIEAYTSGRVSDPVRPSGSPVVSGVPSPVPAAAGVGADPTRSVGVALLVGGQRLLESQVDAEAILAALHARSALPTVSCLMVTRNRPRLAQRAVWCFARQQYPARELVIIDDGEDDSLARWVAEQRDSRLVMVRLEPSSQPLGTLRNLAVEHARGEYVAQWDDDDLSDPLRLDMQMAVLHLLSADLCLLEREQLWWPAERRLALSCRRLWEGAMLCARSALTPYPALRRGEDTAVVDAMVTRGRVALIDVPALYTYVFHGANTFESAHWAEHWQAATERFQASAYDLMIRHLGVRLGLNLAGERRHRSPCP